MNQVGMVWAITGILNVHLSDNHVHLKHDFYDMHAFMMNFLCFHIEKVVNIMPFHLICHFM